LPDETLDLMNIANGAAIELFDHQLAKVMENIADLNTDSKAARTITLKVTFAPFPDRSGALVELKCTSSLVGTTPAQGKVFVTKRGGRLVALPEDRSQTPLFHNEKDRETPAN
jgi:hypothetical protein